MRLLPPGLLPAAAVAWVLVLCAAPFSLARAIVPVPTVAVYGAASVICHQRPERSFHLSGIQIPVCARCFGLYLAGAAGAAAAFAMRRRRAAALSTTRIRLALAGAAVPILLSVGLEMIGAIHGSNVSRFLSGIPFGVVAGWLLERVAEVPHGVERVPTG
jgi:uncharacterized membrane protein